MGSPNCYNGTLLRRRMKPKKLMKGVLVDTAVLCGRIILPIWFLGPGWRTNPDPGHGGAFEELHQSKDQLQRRHEPQSDIPMLQAFDIEKRPREGCGPRER